jgi:hypothetical protein
MASLYGFGADDLPFGAAPFGKYERKEQGPLSVPQSPHQPPVTSDDIRPQIATTMPPTQQLPSLPVAPYPQAASAAPYEARPASYYDRLMSHKRDLTKLLLLALVVTVGLALHGVGKFLVKHYLSLHELTFNQELLLRAAYPCIVIFVVWNIKASTSSK